MWMPPVQSSWIMGVFFIVWVLVATNASSEPDASLPKSFFKDNYAKSVDGMRNPREGLSRGESPRLVETPRVSGSNPGSDINVRQVRPVSDGTGQVPPSSPNQAAVSMSVPQLPPIMRLSRVQLFVNSADSNHQKEVVTKALSLHRGGRMLLMAVYHIGDYRTLSGDLRKELGELKIPYRAAATIPYGEGAKRSPTWVFASLDGMRVVEGILNPERYLDNHGLEPATSKLDAMDKSRGDLVGW